MQQSRDDAGQVAEPGHLRRPEGRAAGSAEHHRGVRSRRAEPRSAWCPGPARPAAPNPRWRPARWRARCGIHGAAVSRVSGAPGLPATRSSSSSDLLSTVHQLTRSTWGASSTSTCSLAAVLPRAAATWSMSANSRCASSRPVCGRRLSTRTPCSASAAVISVSGMPPAAARPRDRRSRSPGPRSTTSSDRMSAPTDPRATASEPRLPGRSASSNSQQIRRHAVTVCTATRPWHFEGGVADERAPASRWAASVLPAARSRPQPG